MTPTLPPSSLAERIAALRVIILALGEHATPPWWRTQFMSDVGLRTMAIVFPRTSFSAAVESAWNVARTDHDGRIGRGRYHLFRLPELLESCVTAFIAGEQGKQELNLLVGGQKGALLSRLNSLANGRTAKITTGPVSFGDSGRLADPDVLAELAAFYQCAISRSTRCYPYFESGKARP